MNIVFTRRLPLDVTPLLAPVYDSIRVWSKRTPPKPAELVKLGRSADVLVCTIDDVIDKKTIQKLPQLKHVITYSVGVNHIDRVALKERSIRLSYTPGALTDATADLTWALILAAARHIVPGALWVRQKKFKGYEPTLFLGKSLSGKVLGIVGMGKIGTAVAERALGFGMQVVFTGRTGGMTLPKLLSEADVVTLHCPLNSNTRHLISKAELATMKPNAILVNTSRGPVIDERALVHHLKKHPEFMAALDVYEFEPKLVPGLATLNNALCIPHIGSATREAREQIAKMCVDEAVCFAKHQQLRYVYPS